MAAANIDCADSGSKGAENQLMSLPCAHKFHKGCIDGWFQLGKFSCPLCRTAVTSAKTQKRIAAANGALTWDPGLSQFVQNGAPSSILDNPAISAVMLRHAHALLDASGERATAQLRELHARAAAVHSRGDASRSAETPLPLTVRSAPRSKCCCTVSEDVEMWLDFMLENWLLLAMCVTLGVVVWFALRSTHSTVIP
jgi:hypothetical protein